MWHFLAMCNFALLLTQTIRGHCVRCALSEHFSALSGPFSWQWSENLPLSFSAASLTSSPVCLRAICCPSPLFIPQQSPQTVFAPRIAQPSRPPQCFSNWENIQTDATACIFLQNTDFYKTTMTMWWCSWRYTQFYFWVLLLLFFIQFIHVDMEAK